MKITIVQGAFLPVPPLLGGAVEKLWFALSKEFARNGHQITYVSKRHPGLSNQESIEGVQHIRVPGFDSPDLMPVRLVEDFIYSLRVRRVLPDAHLVVTNTFFLPLLLSPAKHGRIYVHVARMPRNQYALYRKASRIQTVSNAVAKAIVQQQPRLGPLVRTIHNFVPSALAGDVVSGTWSARENVILYTGRIHPQKGLEQLIDAFRGLPAAQRKDWKLLIIGPWETVQGGGGRAFRDSLLQASADLGASVEIREPTFDTEVLNSLYRSAKLFVYPTNAEKGEALPLAVLEAMSFGCVPIVSSLDCFQELISDGDDGFFYQHRGPTGGQKLAGVLARLMQSDDLQRTVGTRAAERAQDFTLPGIARRYLEDFKTVVTAR